MRIVISKGAKSCKIFPSNATKTNQHTFVEKVRIAFYDGFGCNTTWEGNQSGIKSFYFLASLSFSFARALQQCWFHTLSSFVQMFFFLPCRYASPDFSLFFFNFLLLRIKNVTGCAMLSLLELTQSRKCKILQCDEYQIVKIPILINPAHSIRTKL